MYYTGNTERQDGFCTVDEVQPVVVNLQAVGFGTALPRWLAFMIYLKSQTISCFAHDVYGEVRGHYQFHVWKHIDP